MANWAAISALGTAASGAGDYFGTVALDKKKQDMLAQARANKLEDSAAAAASKEADYLQGREDKKNDGIAAEKQWQSRNAQGIAEAANLREKIRLEDDVQKDADHIRLVEESGELAEIAATRAKAVSNADDGGWSGEFHVDQETGAVSKITKEGDLVPTDRSELTAVELKNLEWTQEELQEEREYQLNLEREMLEAAADLEKNGFDFTEAQSKIYIHYGNGMGGLANAYKALEEGPQGGMDAVIRQLGEGKIMSNWMQTEEAQLYHQAMLVMAEATLRHKSGAALKPDEILLEAKKYMIEVGDTAAMIIQKNDSAQSAVDLMGDTLPKEAKALALSRVSPVKYTDPNAKRHTVPASVQAARSVAGTPLRSAGNTNATGQAIPEDLAKYYNTNK